MDARRPTVRRMTRPRVELLFWDGCPSHPQALAALRRARRPDVPRLPPARRPVLPHPGPGHRARCPRERDDQEPLMSTIAPGAAAPPFDRPDTDGARHTLGGDGEPAAPATVVVFTCNHCPYALAWHDRLLAVARDYADRDV